MKEDELIMSVKRGFRQIICAMEKSSHLTQSEIVIKNGLKRIVNDLEKPAVRSATYEAR